MDNNDAIINSTLSALDGIESSLQNEIDVENCTAHIEWHPAVFSGYSMEPHVLSIGSLNHRLNGGENDKQNRDKNSAAYLEIHDIVSNMQELLDWQEHYISREIGDRAKSVLLILENKIRISPPKIMNEGGEELVFTWEFESHKFYLHISLDELYLVTMDIDSCKSRADDISKGISVNEVELLDFFDISKTNGKPKEFQLFLKNSVKCRAPAECNSSATRPINVWNQERIIDAPINVTTNGISVKLLIEKVDGTSNQSRGSEPTNQYLRHDSRSFRQIGASQ